MKRHVSFLLALGVLVLQWSCSFHELPTRRSGANRLGQSELERLFLTERTVEFSIIGGVATVDYFPDGRQIIDWGSGKDVGTFRIHQEEFCSAWSSVRNGEESCSKIYKISDNEYEFVGSDGTSAAVMRLK
ncbi:MAG: hypothetical protein MUD16_04015 [Desulfobacterales bacterium]|jgi:hypothetical protein|nr:hypothetical protein [Desulfobacterales bacterium]